MGVRADIPYLIYILLGIYKKKRELIWTINIFRVFLLFYPINFSNKMELWVCLYLPFYLIASPCFSLSPCPIILYVTHTLVLYTSLQFPFLPSVPSTILNHAKTFRNRGIMIVEFTILSLWWSPSNVGLQTCDKSWWDPFGSLTGRW